MNEEKTIIEDNDKTIIEDFIQDSRKESSVLKNFKEYTIDKQIEASGESDIYIIYKDAQAFILKLYRMGMNPKEEILRKTKDISDQHVSYFVRIFETGFDEKHKRWYEIQEYIQNGSLKEYKAPKSDLKRIIKNITEGIKILNDSNILHLDIKPANILIRTYNPLELVLTDFGISSILDAELSKKMTQVKGTPLYWSPESFTGVVGKEADFWSLGVIVLELLMGKQPFSGIENKIIMYTLSTKGIEVPENLEDDYKLLLKGLLTREPNKRWGYEQVIKWLNGERNIPVYYLHEEVEKEKEYEKPYKFNGKQYFSLKTLVEAFIENEENWENGNNQLEEGYIKKWLEENNDYDKTNKLKNIVSSSKDQLFFNFIYTFNKGLPFVIYGKLITLKNLHLYLAKDIKKDINKNELKILKNINYGGLINFYNDYKKLTNKSDNNLSRFLNLTYENLNKLNSSKAIYEYLQFLLNPEELLLPNGLEDKFTFIIDNFEILITKNEFDRIKDEYILPQELINNLENNNNTIIFKNYLESINKHQKTDILISKKEYELLVKNCIIPKEIKDGILSNNYSTFIDSILNLYQINNYLLRKVAFDEIVMKYFLPNKIEVDILGDNYEKYFEGIKNLKTLLSNNLLVEKNHINNLLNTYILPKETRDNIINGTYENYQKSAKDLKYLIENKILIDKVKIEEISSKHEIPNNIIININNGSYEQYIQSKKELDNFIDKISKRKKIIPTILLNICFILTPFLAMFICSLSDTSNALEMIILTSILWIILVIIEKLVNK